MLGKRILQMLHKLLLSKIVVTAVELTQRHDATGVYGAALVLFLLCFCVQEHASVLREQHPCIPVCCNYMLHKLAT